MHHLVGDADKWGSLCTGGGGTMGLSVLSAQLCCEPKTALFFWLHWVFVAARAFSSCGDRGLLLVVVRGLLIAVASLVAEHGL